MPSHLGACPLKTWRYIGVFGPELMICVAAVRIGRARQAFWAVWDRTARRLHERTWLGHGGVRLQSGGAWVTEGPLALSLTFTETGGVEAICPAGAAYAWTRKQGGIPVAGELRLGDGRVRRIEGCAVVDDTAGYYPRRTSWRWSAGVGTAVDGQAVAWNLVEGINDPVRDSERTVWVGTKPREVPPVAIARDLSAIGALRFAAEAVREHNQNLLVVRSRYRQPFGTFSGTLPGGPELLAGYGVMEEHDVVW
ncbi:MAG: DUF2804 domain-containing protein [Solirubrobacteraceae bacterium]